jgi:hypothetical protein
MQRTVLIDTGDPAPEAEGASLAGAPTEALWAELRARLEAEAVAIEASARAEGQAVYKQVRALWAECGQAAKKLRSYLVPLCDLAMANGHRLQVHEEHTQPPRTLTACAYYLFRFDVVGPGGKKKKFAVGQEPGIYVVYHRHSGYYAVGAPYSGAVYPSVEALMQEVMGWLTRQNHELAEPVRLQAQKRGY